MKRPPTCPGCGSARRSAPWRLPRQPVVLNYRFATPADAARLPRRTLTLVQCLDCGLVHNATFDPSVIPYDERYENRQCFSPEFGRHLDAVADGIVRRHRLRGGRILEVGCGKGDFLRLLADRAGVRGDGYDTSYEPGPASDPEGVTFHRRYVGPEDVLGAYDAIICRHVVEHVPAIGEFFDLLAALARAAGDPVVVVETPRLEWIVEQAALWDVFYEHCNYFPTPTLAHLARRSGFRVTGHRPVFGGQYQLLELRLARRPRVPEPPGVAKEARLGPFARAARARLDRLGKRFERLAGKAGWAVWGAGAKGVALVNHLARPRPRCVIDSNPAKQGGFLPGTRIPIVAPGDPRVARLGLVVIANPNYEREIRAELERQGHGGRLLTLDS